MAWPCFLLGWGQRVPAPAGRPRRARDDERGAGDGVGDDDALQAEDLPDQAGGDDLGGGALGDDAALAEGDEVIGVTGGLVEVVQDEDDGAACSRLRRRTRSRTSTWWARSR
ncbi:hypothetical protein SF12_13290 [Streptomyces sp. MBRL 601]|nr:hypothetical protein SF12_13290 [Streptomyces sp. MBRL 601]